MSLTVRVVWNSTDLPLAFSLSPAKLHVCLWFPGATGADEIDGLAANGSSPRHSGEKPRAAGQWP